MRDSVQRHKGHGLPIVVFIYFLFIFFILISGSSLGKEAGPSGLSEDKSEKINALYDRYWQYVTTFHTDPQALAKARSVLENVEDIDPNSPDLSWRLAEVSMKTANEEADKEKCKQLCDQVIAYANQALEADPQSVPGHFFRACAHAKMAEISGMLSALSLVSKAKEDYHKVIELDGNHRFAVLSKSILANIYTIPPWPLRDLGKAEPLALEAVKQDPNLTFASKALAMVYIQQKQNSLAQKELQRGLAIASPTYACDSHLYDWPEMKSLLDSIKG